MHYNLGTIDEILLRVVFPRIELNTKVSVMKSLIVKPIIAKVKALSILCRSQLQRGIDHCRCLLLTSYRPLYIPSETTFLLS